MLRLITRRLLCTATARASETASEGRSVNGNKLMHGEQAANYPYLCLFPSPRVVVPCFDLNRRLSTIFSQAMYQLFYERAYNLEGFVHAANRGTSVLGECIADGEWSRMSVIASSDLVEHSKDARQRCTREQLDMIRFHPDDVVLSFLHSSFISSRNFLRRKEPSVISIYITTASFIRKNDSVPYEATLTQLLNRHKKDVIVSNVTFARNLSPLGQWKATSVNFFTLDDAYGRH